MQNRKYRKSLCGTYVCMHVRMYVYICTHMCAYVRMYACMYVRMLECMLCAYVCMHAYVYANYCTCWYNLLPLATSQFSQYTVIQH